MIHDVKIKDTLWVYWTQFNVALEDFFFHFNTSPSESLIFDSVLISKFGLYNTCQEEGALKPEM